MIKPVGAICNLRCTYCYYLHKKSGKASINGVPGKKLNNFGLGLTLGYKINDNLGLTLGYKSTINDGAPDSLRMNQFMVSLVYGWHRLIEGSQRMKRD